MEKAEIHLRRRSKTMSTTSFDFEWILNDKNFRRRIREKNSLVELTVNQTKISVQKS